MLGVGVVASVVLSSVATPSSPTVLAVSVTPPTSVIYVDGSRRGTAARVHALHLSPGRHLVRVVNRKDEHQESVTVVRGKKTLWSWDFEDDRKPEDAPAPREVKATRPAVAEARPQPEDSGPVADPFSLKPGALDTPSSALMEAGARRRAALDRLAAMPSLGSPRPVMMTQPVARKSRHHSKSRRNST
jgi:hypothetical protein